MPQISPEIRKQILEGLITSPRREVLYNKAGKNIEAIASSNFVDKMFLGGSFASYKPNPHDIDLYIQTLAKYAGQGDSAFNRLLHSISLRPTGRKVAKGIDASFFNQSTDMQALLTNPKIDPLKTARSRYGDNYNIIRILSAAGLAGGSMGLLDQLSPDSAEASPVGGLIKNAAKLALGEESSTAKALIGRQLENFGGRTVTAVRKAANGDRRYILFQDGTAQQVTKHELSAVMATVGSKVQAEKFAQSSIEEQKRMAAKRLGMNVGGVLPSGRVSKGAEMKGVGVSKNFTKSARRYDDDASRSIINDAQDKVGFTNIKGVYTTLLRPYAELLEKQGAGTIERKGVVK